MCQLLASHHPGNGELDNVGEGPANNGGAAEWALNNLAQGIPQAPGQATGLARWYPPGGQVIH